MENDIQTNNVRFDNLPECEINLPVTSFSFILVYDRIRVKIRLDTL